MLGDRKCFILISNFVKSRIKKKMSWYFFNGFQHLFVCNAFTFYRFHQFSSQTFMPVCILKLSHAANIISQTTVFIKYQSSTFIHMLVHHIILAMLWIVYCILHSAMASVSLKKKLKLKLGSRFKY